MAPWLSFFQTSAEVAATLIGFLFVAISINLVRILEIAHMPARAAGGVTPLAAVLVISMLALIPSQSLLAFGVAVLVSGGVAAGMAGLFLFQTLPHYRGHPPSWLWSQVLLSQGQSLPLAVAGVLLVMGLPGGVDWVVPAVIFAVVAGVLNAWVLLIEILR
jgi:modulator of FtsH protease